MLSGTYNAKYIYKTMCGFIKDHEYSIEIEKDKRSYMVIGNIDLTEKTYVEACLTFSNEKSIRQHFEIY